MSRTDVFESGGDLQYGAISTPIATRTRPDAIAEPTLSVTAALDRFADASFTTRDKDFSDSLLALNAVPVTGESRAAKLHRLKAEVAQLQIELTASATNAASASASTADDAPLAADVRELAATLDQLNARHVSSMASNKSSTGGSATTTTTTTNKASSIDSSSSSAAESAALERRVAQMESALGLDKSAAPARTDLADAVASLEQRMRDVLDFDATSARVRTLSADIDAVVAKAAAAAATASSAGDGAAASKDGHADGSPLLALRAQVVEAHTLLRQVAPLIKTIPAIAERLRALRTLHTAALDAAGVAARIESAHSDVQSQLKSNSELLAALQKSTAQNNATVKENMAALTKRIESLPK